MSKAICHILTFKGSTRLNLLYFQLKIINIEWLLYYYYTTILYNIIRYNGLIIVAVTGYRRPI